jgi:CRISPR system Cascade subunit CasC
MNARYIDLHLLHQLPVSCLNRGDDQEPKTMRWGNTTRAYVSPQCWKRPVRHSMEEALDEYAARTRLLPLRVTHALERARWPHELAAFAGRQIARCANREGLKTDRGTSHRTQAMLFIPRTTLDDLVALCERHRPALEDAAATEAANAQAETEATGAAKSNGKETVAKKTTKAPKKQAPAAVLPTKDVAALLRRRTATINLFGRMLAEIPDGHVESAVDLAPAFTVHPSDKQPDFFTAVEDWATPHDAHGSAHLQTAFFTSGVFYRFTTVNLTELTRNLDGSHTHAHELLELFLDTFIYSLPQAKKTATAPHTLPYLVHYAVRDRRPISYAAAFEEPVRAPRSGGFTEPARDRLCDYAAAIARLTGQRHLIAHGHTGTHKEPAPHLGTHHFSYDDLIDACTTAATTPRPSAPQQQPAA